MQNIVPELEIKYNWFKHHVFCSFSTIKAQIGE